MESSRRFGTLFSGAVYNLRINSPGNNVRFRPNKLIAFTAVVTGILLLIIGIHIPFQSFPIEYPLDIDILPEIQKLKNGLEPSVQPITVFNYSYLKEAESTCSGVRPNVLFIVKSARYHLQRRKIIRQTWGSKTRFPDVVIRIVFLIGTKLGENNLDKILDKEDEVYNDLVQADFIDLYGNNALKTLSGFKWAVQHCSHAQFIVFSDDDMYISPLNILRFINNPHQYPDGSSSNSLLDSNQSLYAGHVFENSSPLRIPFSKWYISWGEYGNLLWPPYITAGTYIVSRQTLLDLYYGSLFTQFLRFDDVFLGFVAQKAHIHLQHSPDVYFYKKEYTASGYKNVIASHGFDNPEELLNVWVEQKDLGHA